MTATIQSITKVLSSCLLAKIVKIRTYEYKTIIWPVVLYGSETWPLTLREEQSEGV
jgi:hypothetical protein